MSGCPRFIHALGLRVGFRGHTPLSLHGFLEDPSLLFPPSAPLGLLSFGGQTFRMEMMTCFYSSVVQILLSLLFDVPHISSSFFFLLYELKKIPHLAFSDPQILFLLTSQTANLEAPELVREGWSQDGGRGGGPGDFQAASPGSTPTHSTSQKGLVPPSPEAFQGSMCARKRLLREPDLLPSMCTPAALASTSGPGAWS